MPHNATKRAQFPCVCQGGVESNQVLHGDFRAAKWKCQAVERFPLRQVHVGIFEKLVKVWMRKFRRKRDRGDIPAARESIAGVDRTKKITIEILRIVFAKIARRIRQHAQWVNDSLLNGETIYERL